MDNYTLVDSQGYTAFRIAAAGYPLIFFSAFTTLVLAVLGLKGLTLAALVITFCICFFFRDPDRAIPNSDGAVTAPADGKIIVAEQVEGSPYFQGKSLKVSIFMTVFNVHVNRISHEGKVTKTSYHPGKFFSANLDKASLKNEHNAVFIRTDSGKEICIVQIAGLIARRIICNVQEEDRVRRGQRFGLICFGSRLDVYLPVDCNLKVSVGEKVKAGTSILGFLT